MSIHFECTQCGRCCHGLRLTLSVDEATAWAGNGDTVQILTEALPLSQGNADEESHNEYEKARSFPATSGEATIRIAAILVAFHPGPCPHLRPDMRCGNYSARPRICRIYPLESRPLCDPAGAKTPGIVTVHEDGRLVWSGPEEDLPEEYR